MSTYYGLIMPQVYTGGVYIRSIRQTKTSTESGGVNEITSTLTNRKQDVFQIRNGEQGEKGDKGDRGEKGEQGEKGATVETAGMFGFSIDEATGNLTLSYSGDSAPDLAVNGNGELVYTYEEA